MSDEAYWLIDTCIMKHPDGWSGRLKGFSRGPHRVPLSVNGVVGLYDVVLTDTGDGDAKVSFREVAGRTDLTLLFSQVPTSDLVQTQGEAAGSEGRVWKDGKEGVMGLWATIGGVLRRNGNVVDVDVLSGGVSVERVKVRGY